MKYQSSLFQPALVRFFVLVSTTLVAFGIFWAIRDVGTDNNTHRLLAQKLWNSDAEWPPNFLYYWVLGAVGQVMGRDDDMFLAACLILGTSVGLKAYLSIRLSSAMAPSASLALTIALTISLMFAFSIPTTYLLGYKQAYYLGQLSPNVWHNSTTIFLMPVALMIFWLQVQDFAAGAPRRVWVITALTVVGVLIKPSFYMAYAPATIAWIVVYRKKVQPSPLWLAPVVAGFVITLGMSVLIYAFQYGSVQTEDSGLAIRPFAAWSAVTPGELIATSAATSLIVPLVFVMVGFRARNAVSMNFAAMLMVFAVLIFVLLTETGGRSIDGNFYWQTVVCSYILHLVTLSELAEACSRKEKRPRVLICIGVYSLLLVSGAVYLYRLIVLDVPLPY